jgi:formylglycine-generating enzyme required for sulfatase activity
MRAAIAVALSGCALPSDFIKDMGARGGGGGGGGGGIGIPSARSCMSPAPAHDLCGVANAEDCCESPRVEGGSFRRSYDGATFADDAWTASVSTFHLDRFEVTVGRFREMVLSGEKPAVGSGAHPNSSNVAWAAAWNAFIPNDAQGYNEHFANCDPIYRTWTDEPMGPTSEAMPLNCANWYMAHAFCIWDGGRLPSEAEWNFAAAGGDEQRVFPWSVPASSETVDTSYAAFDCDLIGQCLAEQALSIPGSRAPKDAARWGHADLAGNLAEWVLDQKAWSDEMGMPIGTTSYDLPCNDCVGWDGPALNPLAYHAIRGGAFFSQETIELKNGTHYSLADTFAGFGAGFRCARDVAP